MKIRYIPKKFSADGVKIIDRANSILNDYNAQGYDLTLRQLYYQFVARGIIANKDTEYKRLGSIINDARLAGLVDWDHITDRTRNMWENSHWDSPKSIVSACAKQFQFDKWKDQKNYVEVWVEKDALVGVLEQACSPLDVPYFSCRGYTSQSEMWRAAQRLLKKLTSGKKVTIIHLGDHDPSGVDMSRDIEDRLTMFMQSDYVRVICRTNPQNKGEATAEWGERMEQLALKDDKYMNPLTVNRIALTMDQIREYNPPPNPAKLTDARSKKYVEEFGDESWELDSLEPSVITGLIRDAVFELRNADIWDSAVRMEDEAKRRLQHLSDNWESLTF